MGKLTMAVVSDRQAQSIDMKSHHSRKAKTTGMRSLDCVQPAAALVSTACCQTDLSGETTRCGLEFKGSRSINRVPLRRDRSRLHGLKAAAGCRSPRNLAPIPLARLFLTVSMGCMAALLLAPSTHAQSATNFNTKTLTPEASAPKETKAAKPVAKEVGPVGSIPSRQVGPAELEPYLESLSSVLMMRGRATDPFGQLQDPDAKPIIKAPVAGAVKRAAPIQATPFSDIVGMIVVTTIMPGEKRFLIGTRSVKQGDQLPLSFRGRPIRVQVTEVTSRQIGFRNLDSGETASRKLDMLPVGMTPGNRGITAPGMVADRPNAPIELEAVAPSR